MRTWNELSMAEKADVMKLAIDGGVYDLDAIRNGYNEFAKGGSIHIAPSKRGTFTAAAKKHGKSVQAFASQVLSHPENYSPAMRKKANFARNASHWKHGLGGNLFDGVSEPTQQMDNGALHYNDSMWRPLTLNQMIERGRQEQANTIDGGTPYRITVTGKRRKKETPYRWVSPKGAGNMTVMPGDQEMVFFAPIAAGAGIAASPAITSALGSAVSGINTVGDALAATRAGQTLTSGLNFVGNAIKSSKAWPWIDTGLTSAFGAHGIDKVRRGDVHNVDDAIEAGLDILPLSQLARPIINSTGRTVSTVGNSIDKAVDTWRYRGINAGNTPRGLLPEAKPLIARGTPEITAENAASITPEQWTAIQDAAIARGDMAEAQRLRDLHFKVNAPETEVVGINGNPQLVYHKTPNNFTVFDNSRSRGNLNWFATPNAYGENGVFATGAGDNPRTMKLYVNMRNGHKPTIDEGFEYSFINPGEDGLLGIVDEDMTNYFKSSRDAGENFMMAGGVDNPNALKSANAVTYDNSGVRIPLGKRDNFKLNDIRYGLLPFIGLGTLGTLYGTSNR